MSNIWVLVTEELPPKDEFVLVIDSGGGKHKVRLSGTSEPYTWVYKSGLKFRWLDTSDCWISLEVPNE